MRLIDADELKVNCVCLNAFCVDGRTIENAPTVKAIPIEWIKKKCNEADNIGMGIDDWSVKDCYELVLEDWAKENEGLNLAR